MCSRILHKKEFPYSIVIIGYRRGRDILGALGILALNVAWSPITDKRDRHHHRVRIIIVFPFPFFPFGI